MEAVLFDEGQKIQQGDVILRLDQEMEKLALGAAQAKTRQARFELTEVKRRFTDAKRLAKHKTISKNDVQSLQAEVSINGAELQLARVEEQQQEAVLRRHNVLAPFAGIISHKLAKAGEWLSPGDAIAQLIAIEHSPDFDSSVE